MEESADPRPATDGFEGANGSASGSEGDLFGDDQSMSSMDEGNEEVDVGDDSGSPPAEIEESGAGSFPAREGGSAEIPAAQVVDSPKSSGNATAEDTPQSIDLASHQSQRTPSGVSPDDFAIHGPGMDKVDCMSELAAIGSIEHSGEYEADGDPSQVQSGVLSVDEGERSILHSDTDLRDLRSTADAMRDVDQGDAVGLSFTAPSLEGDVDMAELPEHGLAHPAINASASVVPTSPASPQPIRTDLPEQPMRGGEGADVAPIGGVQPAEDGNSHTAGSAAFIHPAESFYSPAVYLPPSLSKTLHQRGAAIHLASSSTTSRSLTTLLLPPPASDMEMSRAQWGEGEFPDERGINPDLFASLDEAGEVAVRLEVLQNNGNDGNGTSGSSDGDVEMDHEIIGKLSGKANGSNSGGAGGDAREQASLSQERLKPLLVCSRPEDRAILQPQHYHPKVLALAAKMAKERGFKLVIDEDSCDRMRSIRANKRRKRSAVLEIQIEPAGTESRLSSPPTSPGVIAGSPAANATALALAAVVAIPIAPLIPAPISRGGDRRSRGRHKGLNGSRSHKAARDSPGGPNALQIANHSARTTVKEVNGALVLVDASGQVVPPAIAADAKDTGKDNEDKESQLERDERRSALFSKGAGSSSWWNHLLISARRQRGPQWDVNTQSYQVDRNSSLYFSYVASPPPSPSMASPKALDGQAISKEEDQKLGFGLMNGAAGGVPPLATPSDQTNSPFFARAVPNGAVEGYPSSGSPRDTALASNQTPGTMANRMSNPLGTPVQSSLAMQSPLYESPIADGRPSTAEQTHSGYSRGSASLPPGMQASPGQAQGQHVSPAEIQNATYRMMQQQLAARGTGNVNSMNLPNGPSNQSALSQVIAQAQMQGSQSQQAQIQAQLQQQRIIQMAQARAQVQAHLQPDGSANHLQYPSQLNGQPGYAMQAAGPGQVMPPNQAAQMFSPAGMGRPPMPLNVNLDSMDTQQKHRVLAFLQQSQQQQQQAQRQGQPQQLPGSQQGQAMYQNGGGQGMTGMYGAGPGQVYR